MGMQSVKDETRGCWVFRVFSEAERAFEEADDDQAASSHSFEKIDAKLCLAVDLNTFTACARSIGDLGRCPPHVRGCCRGRWASINCWSILRIELC